jgi:hypothetical protein
MGKRLSGHIPSSAAARGEQRGDDADEDEARPLVLGDSHSSK